MKKSWRRCRPFKKTGLTTTFSQPTVLIWDSDGEPPAGNWLTVLWSNYDTKGRNDVVSIPFLVEKNAESLRARYLKWIHDLGETKVNGKRIVDHLQIRPGLSYWWMTLLAQKCTYAASPNIYHAIRLLAFEDFFRSLNVLKIKVVTNNPALASELRSWCFEEKREFDLTLLKPCLLASVNMRIIINCFPKPVLGFCLIVLYYVRRLRLQRQNMPARKAFYDGIMLFDILTHLKKPAVDVTTFQSGYWTELPNLIKKLGLRANWGHFFYRHHKTPDATSAKSLVGVLNNNTKEKHFLVDAHFDLKCLIRTIFDFCILIWKGFSIRQFPICFPKDSRFSFRHILRKDWQVSLFGKSLISPLCQLNALEAFLCSIPKQRMGIYIQENQPWEIALLHAWRSNGHGMIIGTPHATIRFWDLRYFYDSRTFQNKKQNSLPTPDKIAVNGPIARAAYNTGLGPTDRLIEVEALRFIETKKTKIQNKSLSSKNSISNRRPVLLVATDLLDTNTSIQLEWVEKAIEANKTRWKIVVRPHPASDFSKKKYPQWHKLADRSDLSELLQRVNVIFCSNASSIAVDGCLAGKPVITMINGQIFNFSPLRGLNASTDVTSLDELKAALCDSIFLNTKKQLKYFCLSKDLNKWKTVLSECPLLA